jgi:hypothetical protein
LILFPELKWDVSFPLKYFASRKGVSSWKLHALLWFLAWLIFDAIVGGDVLFSRNVG